MKILSYFPGRIRIQSDAFTKDATLQQVRQRLETVDGIRDLACNLRTGSLTITYDPAVITNSMLLEAKDELEKMEDDLLAG